MSLDLLQTVREHLGENLIGSIAAKTDETELGIKQAVQNLIPIAGIAVANKSRDDAFALIQYAQQNNVLDHVIRIANNTGDWKTKSEYMANSAYGKALPNILKTVADAAQIKENSVTKLLNLLTPIVTGIFGKVAKDGKMNAADFSIFLSENVGAWKNLLPTSLGIDSLFTTEIKAPKLETTVVVPEVDVAPAATNPVLEEKTASAKNAEQAYTAPVQTTAYVSNPDAETFTFQLNEKQKKRGGMGWIVGLFLLAGLGALGWWLWNNYQQNKSKEPVAQVKKAVIDSSKLRDSLASLVKEEPQTGKFDSISGFYKYNTGAPTEIVLPNNLGKLNVGSLSSEKRLFDQLSNPNWKPNETDKTKGWYHFDNVFYKSAFYEMTPESQTQINNIALILKAFPKAILKIGGYTDNSGDATANKMLSDNRAKMLMNRLVAQGVEATRIQAEGYGQEHPICPENNNNECKSKNRRVDFRVMSK